MQVFGTKSIEATLRHTSAVAPQLINLALDQDASGMTGFASIHYKPNKLWDFTANFTGPVKLDWSTDIETNSARIEAMIRKDDVREDLPAVFVLGAKRNFFTDNGNFELKTNLTYYLQSDFGVRWDDTFAVGSVDNRQESFGDGYEASLGGTWEPVNSQLKYYAGYLYSNPRADIDTTSKFKPSLVSSTLGLGLDYKLNDNVTLNFGSTATFYNTETTSDGDELSRRTYVVGTGLKYYF
jgi:long-subunit fatty acid transport protein